MDATPKTVIMSGVLKSARNRDGWTETWRFLAKSFPPPTNRKGKDSDGRFEDDCQILETTETFIDNTTLENFEKPEKMESGSTTLDEERGHDGLDPFSGLLERLSLRESQSTLRERLEENQLEEHLENISRNFCNWMNDNLGRNERAGEAANNFFHHRELRRLFVVGNPDELNLCGRLRLELEEINDTNFNSS